MVTRRNLLIAFPLGSASALLSISGHGMTKKPKITSFGKPFSYLKDPELRRKETSDSLLRIEGALFSGEHFEDVEWRNVDFVGCDFIGGYEIGLSACVNVTFTDCNFSGVLSWGDTLNVRFLRCGWAGQSVMYGEKNSKNTVFESCVFVGTSSEKNQWGAVGTHGEALFINCNAKWFNLDGDVKLDLQGCVLEDVICEPSKKYGGSHVTIENCKLRGLFRMAGGGTLVQSLTIRDTVLEELNLSNATVKGDVVIERVKGNFIHAGVTAVRSLTVSDSEILGNGRDVSFLMSMDGAQQVLLERTNFGAQMTSKVSLGPGRPLQANEWSAVPLNKSAVIRNCTLPIMDASWLETQHLQIEGNTIGSLNVSNGRMGKLELRGNTIARSVDFTNTQVKESKVQALAKGQAKLEGSNIKAN